jgi:hypothetical protein
MDVSVDKIQRSSNATADEHAVITVLRDVDDTLGLSPPANYTDRATAACRRS